MLRLYYITLCGEYEGRYVEIYARDKDRAVWSTERVFGVMNVSTVYTAKAWRKKYTGDLISVGKSKAKTSESTDGKGDERQMRETAIKVIIVIITAIIIAVLMKIITWLYASGVFKRINAWLKSSKIGITLSRVVKVTLFVLAVLFIGYFIFTGYRI